MPLVLTSKIDEEAAANIRGLFTEAKALYAPGGEFIKGVETQLARGRKRTIAGGMQSLVAAGLAGTSIAGGLAKKYEEEVAAPAMARATTTRLSALSGLFAQEASAELQMASRYGYQAPQRPTARLAPQRQLKSRADALWQQVTQSQQKTARPQQTVQSRLPGLNLLSVRRPVKQAPAASPLSSFYGGDVSGRSLMQQADPYDISGRYF